MRYRHLFLGLLTANAASLLFFYGCDLKSGGDGTDAGPLPEASVDGGPDTGPGGECGGADTQTDEENCGECGHACLGATCNAGRCDPTHVSRINNAGEIAIDDAGIVVTESKDPGSVYYVAFDGDGGATMVRNGDQRPNGPSTNGTTVCWANSNRVSCALPDGGDYQPGTGGNGETQSTLISGSNLYYLNEKTTEVFRRALDAGVDEQVAWSGDPARPDGNRSLILDGTQLVWVLRGKKTVFSAPMSATSVLATVVATIPEGFPMAVAAGPDAYYIAVENASPTEQGGIYRAPKTGGGAATPLFRQSLTAPSIAVDGDFVYYTNKVVAGAVYKFKIGTAVPDGGAPALAVGQPSATSIRIGPGGFVYWANDIVDGGLMRVAK